MQQRIYHQGYRLQKIVQLEQHHRQLDEQIIQGHSNYINDQHLAKLKHEKLLTKMELNRLKLIQGDNVEISHNN
jgi:hypothetical protein